MADEPSWQPATMSGAASATAVQTNDPESDIVWIPPLVVGRLAV